MQQPPFYNQPTFGQPQKPPKKSRRRLWIILAIIGGVLALSCTICGIVGAMNPQPTQAPAVAADTPTQAPTATPSPTPSPTATPTPKPRPTATPKPKPAQGPAITHGTPHLGGPVSDFYGKYGTDVGPAGVQTNSDGTSSVGWCVDSHNADICYTTLVHYSGSSHLVNYINYSGPSSWSKAQYRDYLISTFAPPGTAEDTQTNQWWANQGGDPFNPIAYTSDIGKFFLHISDGNGWMNTA